MEAGGDLEPPHRAGGCWVQPKGPSWVLPGHLLPKLTSSHLQPRRDEAGPPFHTSSFFVSESCPFMKASYLDE